MNLPLVQDAFRESSVAVSLMSQHDQSINIQHLRQSHKYGCIPACLSMVLIARQHSGDTSQETLQKECKMLTEENLSLGMRLRKLFGRLPKLGVSHEGVLRAAKSHDFGIDILCFSLVSKKFTPHPKSLAIKPIPLHSQTEAWTKLQHYIKECYPVIVMLPNINRKEDEPDFHAIVIYKIQGSRVYYADPAGEDDKLVYYPSGYFLEEWAKCACLAYILR